MGYEFLASFEQWEQDCWSGYRHYPDDSHDLPDVDALPIQGMTSLISKAQSLATLLWDDDAQEMNPNRRRGLDKVVKDGDYAKKRRDGRRWLQHEPRPAPILGYPGLVNNLSFRADPRWFDLLLPSPEKLSGLPDGSLLLRVDVELLTPFFSKDDTAFYPTDNVLRRDKVFEIPFLSAAGVKGLLRWAHRMASDSITDDTAAEVLFGKARDGDNEASRQGLLYFWPLIWASGNIGLDVINPLNRDTGAGTIPIKYEVVLPKAKGSLYFLLMPAREKDGIDNAALQDTLLRDLGWLLENGGLSAKKTADWGRVKVTNVKAAVAGAAQGSNVSDSTRLTEEEWASVLNEDGSLKELGEKPLQRLLKNPKGKKKNLQKELQELYKRHVSGAAATPTWLKLPQFKTWSESVQELKTHIGGRV